jgi:hypothetical protein
MFNLQQGGRPTNFDMGGGVNESNEDSAMNRLMESEFPHLDNVTHGTIFLPEIFHDTIVKEVKVHIL